MIDHDLVDAVLAETGACERRVRLLPARVVYCVLAFAFFERLRTPRCGPSSLQV